MKIAEFAERFRVKTQFDSCGEWIIPGKPYKAHRPEDRNQIFDHGDDEHFGVSLLLTTARQWRNAAKRLLAVGMTVLQTAIPKALCSLILPTKVRDGPH
ncbi:MAG TPA: hypothetical protein VKB49_25095 [Candidatus Sulfotelmatobacter sp.]|nr:hypothetical protein [Candidatus Sulfotelmatobacter sp.]